MVGAGQVDLDDVVRAARHELGPELVVDHVVRGRDHVLERARGGGLVPERPEWLDVRHSRGRLATRAVAPLKLS
jgi:hypothetical protein